MLTDQQQEALEACKRGENVFITGAAGSGKSFLVNEIVYQIGSRKNVVKTSTTGISAVLIGGTTINSFAGVGLCTNSAEDILKTMAKTTRKRWRDVEVLVFDEVSLMTPKLLSTVEEIARMTRYSCEPMGGIQCIFVGDFCQLPPVHKTNVEHKFIFQTPLWNILVARTFVLEKIHRQSGDSTLIDALNKVRMGEVDEECSRIFNATAKNDLESISPGIKPTKLFATNKDVDHFNDEALSKLEGDEVVFRAKDTGEAKLSYTFPEVLRLKKGAQVMLLVNFDLSSGLVNGSRGVVESACDSGVIRVKFTNDTVICVEMATQQVFAADGKKIRGERRQYPLRLAYAMTIHKSQGATIDLVEVDLSKTFAEGQAYVALSRGVSLDRMRVIGFESHKVKVAKEVIDYLKSFQENEPRQKKKRRIDSN